MNQTGPIEVRKNHLTMAEWGPKVALAIFFIGVGTLIYVVFSPYRPMLEKTADYLGRIGLIFFLFMITLLPKRFTRLEKYTEIFAGLLIMGIAVSLDWILGVYLLDSLGVNSNTPAGFALIKLNECLVVAGAIIFLTHLRGGSLGSIYIQKGNLKLGLMIGSIAFVVALAGSIPMANLMFKGNGLSLERIVPWLPWILIFVFANATQEELMLRGLFLRKLQPFFGKLLSNFLIIFVFTLLHKGVTYTANELMFLVVLLPLAFVWGYIMQKTDSIWGSILFHAGMDIPVILGIFSGIA
jgi:uncharacterized protein